MANTIYLKGHDKGHHNEGTAGGAITPGMAVELQANGTYLQQSSALAEALKGPLLIAVEDALQGKTINDAYANGDRLFFVHPQRGDHINALVKTGANIAVDDNLVQESGGSGLFVEAAGTEGRYTLKALESSGGALAANTHIKCEVV